MTRRRPGWTWARTCPNSMSDLPPTYFRVVGGSATPERLHPLPVPQQVPQGRGGSNFHPY